MKKLSLFVLVILLSFNLFSQSTTRNAPRVQWQRCLGGTGSDYIDDVQNGYFTGEQRPLSLTSDSGYILGGVVASNDGDISGNHGGADIWLTRLDKNGSTIWKKTFGGTLNELIGSIRETRDHGFIVVGSTFSNDGDVSGNHGALDYWVLRLDASGNIIWQKSLGGSSVDKAYNVAITPDDGFVVTGFTQSANGDVSGNHLGGDSTDVWVVKLNSAGSILWQKSFGGSARDEGISVDIANDGGIVLGNTTSSNNGDVSGNHGRKDIWVVKMDQDGNITWQKCFGGSLDEMAGTIKKVSGNEFIIAGSARSNDGNVVGHNAQGFGDEPNGWVVKLDSLGNIVWSKCYGAAFGSNLFNDVIELPDGNFVACGYTEQNIIGGNFESINPWSRNAWVIGLSSGGSILWQDTYGSQGYEIAMAVVKAPDDGFLMLGVTSGGITDPQSNDVSGSHGTASDLWVVKLSFGNIIKGIVYLDRNLNGVKDSDEPLVAGGLVRSVKDRTEMQSISNNNGGFTNRVDTGSYLTTVQYNSNFVSVPGSKASAFATYNKQDVFNFALQPLANKRDLAIAIVSSNVARPGFNLSYRIFYKNNGTDTVANGEILFIKDSRLSFLSAAPSESSTSGDTLKWTYSNLKPLDAASISINLSVKAPPVVNNDDTLSSLAIITPVTNDLTPADDTARLNQRVQGSYDPNDKSENLAGQISQREVSSNSYIDYLIRFQNTGTDTAFTVTVRDTLDDKLDWNSLQMVAASHSYQLNIKSQNQLTWSLNNILLVDSFRNEPASHGFIAYRVKPKSSLVIGDVIKNTASIYFDYNLPVETNTLETEVVQYSINNPQVGIPTISSFTPVSATSGATVTITGTNLTGATEVGFGGFSATSFIVNSGTTITAVVGAGASGDVSVTTPGGTATLAGFIFIPAPTITSFTPNSGGAGTSITITGTNFTGATAVSFGGTAATSFTVNSATSISGVVGGGASGNVSVVTPGGTATLAGFTFTVVTAIDPVPANSLGIRFYPNPTKGSFVIDTLKLADKWETLEIFDTQGKQKLSNFIIKNKTRVNVNVEYLSNGLYMAILKRRSGPATVIKFLKY